MAIDNTRYSLEEVELTLRKHEKRLLACPNVMYLAIGEKMRRGKGKNRLSIRVCVSKKLEHGCLGAVPARLRAIKLDGSTANYYIPIDVEEMPLSLKALGMKGGDSVVAGFRLGSIGLVLQDQNSGTNYILTNAHVALAIDQEAKNQPLNNLNNQQVGTIFKATMLSSQLGYVHYFDAAIATVSVEAEPWVIDGIPTHVNDYGNKDDFTSGFGQQYFYQRGDGSRLIFRVQHLVSTKKEVTVEAHKLYFNNFFELELVQGPPPQEGDSGSVIVFDTGNGLTAYGLLFAGVDKTIGAIPIKEALSALGLVT